MRLLVAEVTTAEPAALADLAKHGPRLAHRSTGATVLVRLTELAALVLPMRRMSHDGSCP
ncbi:hypothetical protein NOCA2220148 [metagenome]|uniref:Uncharacterized protein n=1 Tax=metagenome TaxID=256318 RepID=A0A2P2BYX1_9ZZZZ